MAAWQQAGIAGCLTLLITLTGVLEPLEYNLLSLRYKLDHRPASGELVVVQIDARSIQELGVWPFARSHHAQVIDRLREAGASAIAFDIELSRSQSEEDNAFLVDALKRAGGQVILPSFIQLASAGAEHKATIRTEPDPLFASHAWVANVNVYPSDDGRIWTMTYGDWHAGRFQYSLAATLAGRATRDSRSFYVDYGIALGTIPRLSFVDVLHGKFDAAALRGKRVIVGGTAVELGDQLNLPTVGVVSGPVLQALTFETIFQNREIWRTSMPVSLTLAALALCALAWGRRRLSLGAYIGCVIGFGLLVEAGAMVIQGAVAISVDSVPVLLAAVLMGLAVTRSELEARRDLAAKARIENENRRRMLDRVIQDSFDGVVILDDKLHVLALNAAASDMFGMDSGSSSVGKLFTTVVPHWEKIEADILQAKPFQNLGKLQEIVMRTSADEPRTFEVVITQSDLDDAPGLTEKTRPIFTITLRDVTERRNTEKERDLAMQEALAANRAKTEFLANMSHELRTPLNAIIGFSEVMHGEMFGPLGSPQYIDYASDIEASGRHLLAVVNDILDVSRIETGELTASEEETDVRETLESVTRLAGGWPAAQDRQIVINVEAGLPKLWGDSRLLKQMVLNLLSNAVKFSEAGSQVSLTAARSAEGGINIKVSDQGVGIPKECLPRLTEAFYQVDSSLQRQFEGSGLGLTLVQKHMALHGGTLEFESEVGVGTTATLTFPPERACGPSRSEKQA